MSRPIWFVAGAGAGIYAMHRARRLAESVTVEGLRDRVGALAVGARMLGADVARGRAEKETELRERYSMQLPGPPELTSRTHPEEDPA